MSAQSMCRLKDLAAADEKDVGNAANPGVESVDRMLLL
jgi:hypothetical protein